MIRKTIFMALCACISLGAMAQGLPEVADSGVGYASRDEAVAALRAKPGVVERSGGDWLVFTDNNDNVIWSITEPGHSAHPSIVKRAIVKRDGAFYIQMGVKCGASKETCDELARSFRELNDALRERIRSSKTG